MNYFSFLSQGDSLHPTYPALAFRIPLLKDQETRGVHFQARHGAMCGDWISGIIHSCLQIACRQNWIWPWNRHMSNACIKVIIGLMWHNLLVLISLCIGKHSAEMTIVTVLTGPPVLRFWNINHLPLMKSF